MFDGVRTDVNDITLFKDGKSIGFISVEPIPADLASTSFLETLKAASASDIIELELSPGFNGFAVKKLNYMTGYVLAENQLDLVLVFSFAEDEFEQIAGTISPGI